MDETGWLFWLLLGGALCIAELSTGTFYLLVAGVAALAASLAAYLGLGVALQLGLAAAVALLGLPVARRLGHAPRGGKVHVDEGLAVRLIATEGGLRADHSGSLWHVREIDGQPMTAGDAARIVRLDGNTLLVRKGE